MRDTAITRSPCRCAVLQIDPIDVAAIAVDLSSALFIAARGCPSPFYWLSPAGSSRARRATTTGLNSLCKVQCIRCCFSWLRMLWRAGAVRAQLRTTMSLGGGEPQLRERGGGGGGRGGGGKGVRSVVFLTATASVVTQ